jgi:four helix bundle protein
MTTFKNLDARKLSMQLVKDIYLLTKNYPKEEMFGLTSQSKRAAVSIPTNISEGVGRQYKKDSLQFFHIARGSVYELETLLNIALMTEVIDETRFNLINPSLERVAMILNGLINSYEKRNDLK